MAQLTVQDAFNLALQRHGAGQLADAERLYQQIISADPNHSGALHFLGVLAHQKGNNPLAIELMRRSIAISPNIPDAHTNLGIALEANRQLDDAIAAYGQTLALNPGHFAAHHRLGLALKRKGRLDDAIAAFRRAIAIKPDFADAHFNLGVALLDARQMDEAVVVTQRAIALNPNNAQAYCNLGNALKAKWQPDQAIAAYQTAVALQPDYSDAWNNLGSALKTKGNLDGAIEAYRRALSIAPDSVFAHSNLVCTLHYHPGYDAKAIGEELRRWNERHALPLAQPYRDRQASVPRSVLDSSREDAQARSAPRRLTIGYVSPDFSEHPVAHNLISFFREHDRQQFTIICYAQVARPDRITDRFRTLVDAWRNTVGWSDEQLAKQIREDHIDILVDLALHTAGNRLFVFARKLAPVQVTFAGYPGSTGLTAIDYRLSDPYLDPPQPDGQLDAQPNAQLDESVYSEKTIRLPDCFWCYDPMDEADLPVVALPALANGLVTFGSLNKFCKLNDAVVTMWASAMRQIPRSRLILMASEGSHRRQLLDLLAKDGIDSDRVEFVTRQPRRQYLQIYNRIDIGLDVFPYNGHTTSLDSFWMGVPVVTLVGQTVVSRAGWCQLSNLGLPELAAHAPAEFSRIAVELANNLPRLASLRSTLRRRMEQSPLMDGRRFARNIEAAYRQMWQQGASPDRTSFNERTTQLAR